MSHILAVAAFLFSARAGVLHVTVEELGHVWRLNFQTDAGDSAMVVLPYIVEKTQSGHQYFFDPTDLCRHVLLQQVRMLITVHTFITCAIITGGELLSRK